MSARRLLGYQRRWVQDQAALKVVEKSRRIGMSWAEAYDAVLHAAGGRGDVYFQSYAHDMARGFVSDCGDWAQVLQVGADAVGEMIIDAGDGHAIQAFRLGLASGRQIVAMSSSPRGFRSKGRPGDRAILDEAAFVDDLGAVLTAAMAFRVWGGTVHVLSTHNGEASPFAALVRDIRRGQIPGSLHRVTLRDALEEGLYQRICSVTGVTWSAAAEERWEVDLRAEYSHGAAEELDCIPSAGGGAWLSWEQIRHAEDADAGDPDGYSGGPIYIGVDIALRRDLWVAVVIERVGDVWWVREIRTERGITFSEQRGIVKELVERYRPLRVAVDQTGMGEGLVEQLGDDHGSRVEGVLMTGPRRLDIATILRGAFEDRQLRIPEDRDLRQDLHAVRSTGGATGAPRLVADRAGTDGHADRFWALALALAAGADPAGPFEGASIGPARVGALYDQGDNGDNGLELDVSRGVVVSPARTELARSY